MRYKMNLSKSIMNSYLYCPMQCKLQFIDRIKVKPSEPLIRGIAVHKALEKYYDNLNINNMYEDYKKEIDQAMFLSEEAQKYRYYMIGIYNFEIRRALHCIKHKKELKTYFIPKYRELRIESKELGWVGYIDTIPQLFNDKLAILDYKSADPKKKIPDKLSQALQEEIMFYYILFKSVYDDEVGLLGVLYTHIKDSLRNVTYSKELEDKTMYLADFVRSSIEMDVFPKTDAKYKCVGCDYKGHCK